MVLTLRLRRWKAARRASLVPRRGDLARRGRFGGAGCAVWEFAWEFDLCGEKVVEISGVVIYQKNLEGRLGFEFDAD